MKAPRLVVLILSLALCVAGSSTPKAKTKGKPAAKKAPAVTRETARKSETQKFTGLKLKGQLKKPDLSYIYKRKGLRAEQIVNIPENFNDSIIQGENQF